MFRLLLHFFTDHRGRPLTALTLADLDAPAVLAFLDHLEQQRGNSIPTRNVRLAALRSFLKYASARDPTCLPIVQRVLAFPTKWSRRPLLGYLSREEMAAILNAPDATTWSGQRDQVLGRSPAGSTTPGWTTRVGSDDPTATSAALPPLHEDSS
jgi:site-specific recombinase XerD